MILSPWQPWGSCSSRAGDSETLIHEFGHVFDNYFKGHLSSDGHFAADYLNTLKDKKGNYVIGNDSAAVYRTSLGYVSGLKSLKHDFSWKGYKDPYDKLEEFADMYLNWVMDGPNSSKSGYGFSDDSAGNVRRNFMDNNMLNIWLPGK